MHFHHWKLAVLAAFTVGGTDAAYAQNAVEQLQSLVETTVLQLTIGEQVALAKWDNGKPVEDAPACGRGYAVKWLKAAFRSLDGLRLS